MTNNTTRRDFVKQTALGFGGAWWLGTQSLSAQERSPVERLNFACIGVGGKGSSDTDDASRNGNVVALCDIDSKNLEQKAVRLRRNNPGLKTYTDYRKMMEEMGDDIDAVTVSTPDHTHAPASTLAMSMGKHCFTQKPLAWSVEEARAMRELAAKKKVATQMGNQGTSHAGLREAVEIIRDGALGTVTEVHVWTNRPIWPQGEGRPSGSDPVPEGLDWNMFLGAAPERPYVNNVYHPFKWRGWLDFGTGALGDMACHTANMAVMALNLFDPTTVEAIESSGIVEDETYPKYSRIEFQFPEFEGRGPVKFVWYDGGKRPDPELLQGKPFKASGSLVLGTNGTLYSPDDYGSQFFMLPEDVYADYKKPEPSLPRTSDHFAEFAAACKGGPKSMSDFSYAGRLTETILLGNIALKAGQKVEWDAKNMKITNIPNSEHLIKRDYRDGFGLHLS
jgi:predicted dehydrogenase